ncbi:hypothetical protein CU097_004433 [Rhizopus azygosporus]|uniref:Uncharacterized protein n=1 Tax=Rhizopus azygosporus TaxID=86630 RepID=A0A367IST2_RHIAZ|nr:hypothetical protein CU097_004433 [Rhizopus azygosporus]
MLYGLAKDYTLQGKERQDNFADVIDSVIRKKCMKIIDRLVDYDKRLKKRCSEMDESSSGQEQRDEPTYVPLTLIALPSSSYQEERDFVISFKKTLNGGRISWSRCLSTGHKKVFCKTFYR